MGSTPYLGGGFGHFYAYAEEKQQYPIDRYTMETKRQLDVLDRRLANNSYMCGDEYTIADMAIWPWYGGLVIFDQYGAEEFLDAKSYANVLRWAEESKPASRSSAAALSTACAANRTNSSANAMTPGISKRRRRTRLRRRTEGGATRGFNRALTTLKYSPDYTL